MICQWIFRPPKKFQDLQTPQKNQNFPWVFFVQVYKGEKFKKSFYMNFPIYFQVSKGEKFIKKFLYELLKYEL